MTRPPSDVDDGAADHYLRLPGANVVATESLLSVRDNLADVIEAKAMMCVHGAAGLGKTLSVNTSLREQSAGTVCRVQFPGAPDPARYPSHPVRGARRGREPAEQADRVRSGIERCSGRTIPGAGV